MKQQCTIDRIKDVLSDLQSQLDAIPQSKKATDDNNEKASEKPAEGKKKPSSLLGWVRGSVKKAFKAKKETSNHASDSGGSQGGSRKSRRNIGQDQVDADLEILKLQSDIHQMKAAFENLTHFQNNISKSLETEVPSNKLKAILLETDSVKSRARDLKEIRRKVLNLKGQIPSLLKKQSSIGLSVTDSQTSEENSQIVETGSDISLPGLHVSEDFKYSSAFEEVVEKFQDLSEFTQKLCLLSFAVFPENKEVKKTMLMYWWIGEGFISYDDSEISVTRILDEFSRNGLLEPVEDERKLKPSSYKMEPHVHSAVIYLARSMNLFSLHSSEGKRIMHKSEKKNVCLVKGSSLQQNAKTSVMDPKTLNSVFNSSERYPDFTFRWFPRMESLRVLYLGRWERTANRHIEVESTEFLKDMKSLKSLRLASFQGISRIENLKDLICSLPKLVILDLRACYNLEVLPDDIGSLESLIYLDVSECYMLDRMPKGISDLRRLQVLKGFVISQSDDETNCAVQHLENLRKLSITVNKYDFMVDKLMVSLKHLELLESLKIAWGARFPDEDIKDEKMEETDEANEEKQQGHATEEKHNDLKEGEDDQVHKKGETSEEKEGDVEEKGKREVRPEDGVSSKKEDGNEKANLEEGKKCNEVKTESLKSAKVVEGEKKTNLSPESTETIQKRSDDQEGISKVEGDGDKVNADQEEGKKRQEAKKTESLESEKKASPSREEIGTIQNKPDDGDEGKAATEEETKQDKVDGEKSRSESGVEGVEKASPSSESTNTIENKPGDHQKGDKQEEEGDGEKEKVNREEGKKKDEVKAESSKPGTLIERDEKTSPPQESKDIVKSKPDDHQIGDKQEEKGDRQKEKVNLEDEKKKDELKAESSKPGKVIEGDKKISPSQESKDTIQSKPDDHKENSKVQEKGDGEKIKGGLKKPDGGEAKTQKLDKNKLGKKVSFSEEPRALIQKPNDPKKDNAMATSQSRSKKTAFKESGSSRAKPFTIKKNETKRWGKKGQEDLAIDISTLPASLKNLELECFPYEKPPIWLNPKTLDNLKKLSIKGGKLSRFSDEPLTAENKCGIQILRLKYLHEFKAEWKDLQTLFPKLKLLEKYKCPKVAFCPTDGSGVWSSQP